MVEDISFFENISKNLPAFKNHTMDPVPDDENLTLGGYELHRGLRPKSKHWRKPKEKGCFHITVHENGSARIHWDAWDPRRYPARHACEIMYRFFIQKPYLRVRSKKSN